MGFVRVVFFKTVIDQGIDAADEVFFLDGFESAFDEFTELFRENGEGLNNDANVGCGEETIDDDVFGEVLVELIGVEDLNHSGQGVHVIDFTLVTILVNLARLFVSVLVKVERQLDRMLLFGIVPLCDGEGGEAGDVVLEYLFEALKIGAQLQVLGEDDLELLQRKGVRVAENDH